MLKLSLKSKMTFMVSLLVGGLLSLSAIIATTYFSKQFRQTVSAQQYAMVSTLADEIDSKILISQAMLVNVAGTITQEMIADPAKAARFLDNRPDTRAVFSSGLFFISPAGKIIAGPSMDLVGKGSDCSINDCFQKTLASRKPHISEPFFIFQGKEQGKRPVVMFSAPILNGKGVLIAVLAGGIDLLRDNFLGKLAATRLGENGYLYLYNTNRTMIMHPDRARILRQDVPKGANRLFDEAIEGFEGTGETVTSRGLHMLSSFKRLKTTNWILAANYPVSEAFAPIALARNFLLTALLLMVMFSIFVVWLAMRYLTAPLLLLTNQARDIATRKDAAHRLEIATGDEIETLAQAFNNMVEELDGQQAVALNQVHFLQILINSLPYPVFYKDVAGKYIGCNKSFEEYVGIPREQLLGKSVVDIAPPPLAEICCLADKDLFRHQGQQSYESPVRYADGTLHDVVFFKATFNRIDGTLGGLIGSMLDITDRKRTENLLAEQKEFADNLLQNSSVPGFVIDAEHRVLAWNRACENLTGITSAEIVGTSNHWQAFYDEPRPCLADLIIDPTGYEITDLYSTFGKSDLIASGIQAEGWFPQLNGKERYLMFNAAPISNRQGELVAVIQTLEDITPLRKNELSLLAALSLVNATLEATADGILVVDGKGRIVSFNKQFMEMWRMAEDVIAAGDFMMVKGFIKDQLKEPNEIVARLRYFKQHPDIESNDIAESRDGRVFEISSKPQWVDESIVGRVFSFRDITDKKNLEEQLRHSQKMESIGTLAGGVAHDFNNILTAIIGYGYVALRAMAEDDPQRLIIDHILEAADRAAHLTKDLLLFSRKQIVDRKTVDLNVVVAKVEKFLQRVIGEDIECRTVLQEVSLPVLADVYQLEQVLMNLAANARDAMPQGGALTVTTEISSMSEAFTTAHGFGTPGHYALMTVSDCGVGMAEETRQHIFEPFFTTKEVGKGTGLGLSVVYGIIKQHEGYINVYSEPGNGTTFRIYLPVIPPQSSEEISVYLSEAAVGGVETILLAEDDKAVRDLTRTLLTEFGYTIIEAIDGEDAVKKFTANKDVIDLLIFDLIMPKMNGKEAYDEIRKVRAEIKAIFSSGYAPETIRQKAALTDGAHLIAKPTAPADLLRKVRNVLDDKK